MSTVSHEQDLLSAGPEELAPKQLADVDAIRTQLIAMLSDGRGENAIEMLLELLVQLRDAHTATSVRLQDALRKLYGRSSEKVSTSQLQLVLSALVQGAPDGDADKSKEEAVTQDGPAGNQEPTAKRKRPSGPRGRAALPAHLERRVTQVPPRAEDCFCTECKVDKRPMGSERSEWLEYEPPTFFVRVEERPKMSCPKCRTGVVSAEASDSPLPGALPGPGLLSLVLVSRFKDGLPLNRQASIYEKRYGVRIATSTLGAWSAGAADLLPPLVDLLKDLTLRDFLLQTDDTGIRVLDPDDPRGIKRGHLWVYVGEGQHVFVDYTPNWAGKGPQDILMLRTGYIQADGYAGYDALFTPGSSRTEVACWMHARRGFEKAFQAGDARGGIILGLVQQLYAVERSAKEEGCTPDERLARRLVHSIGPYEEIFHLLDQWAPHVAPKTPIGQAITYARNRRIQLARCFDDGRIPLDNGEVERLIRLIAIMRNNSLFVGSDAAGHRAANVLSLVLACHRISLDPWAYFRDILPRLGASRFSASRLAELLPSAWCEQQAQHARAQ